MDKRVGRVWIQDMAFHTVWLYNFEAPGGKQYSRYIPLQNFKGLWASHRRSEASKGVNSLEVDFSGAVDFLLTQVTVEILEKGICK